MINKEFIFSKISELEEMPKGILFLKTNNIYFDHLNLTWLNKDILRSYGVSSKLTSKFMAFYGRLGEEAKPALNKPFSVSNDDIQILFKVSVRISIQEVFEHLGGDVFKELSNPVQLVLVSLWRQFGRFSGFESPALTMVTRMLVRGHIKSAIRYLKDERGWSNDSKRFMPRRLKEAAILETLVEESK
jgi:hypothetical protein